MTIPATRIGVAATCVAACLCASLVGGAAGDPPPAKASERPERPSRLTQKIDGTTLELTLVSVTPPAAAAGSASRVTKPFYIATVETTWDLYDTFVFGFDQKEGKSGTPAADAISRPSKPYISMDRGFGHAGFPAISVSFNGAKTFCEWLSAKTGRKYRLPTVEEWQLACQLGAVNREALKDFALTDYAWFADNSEGKSHAVATRKADALGCHDLYGNASEWCVQVDDKGTAKGVTLGGTFRDPADKVGCAAVVPYSAEWNASDPQFPKSKWWLADGGFVGFRVVCEE